jgi:hypothetical protein
MRAGRFLNTLPEGAALGVYGRDLRPGGQPPFDYQRFRLTFLLRTSPGALAGKAPDYVVVPRPLDPAPSWEPVEPAWRRFLEERYEPAASFDEPLPVFGRYVDRHYHARFPVHVFKRGGPP